LAAGEACVAIDTGQWRQVIGAADAWPGCQLKVCWIKPGQGPLALVKNSGLGNGAWTALDPAVPDSMRWVHFLVITCRRLVLAKLNFRQAPNRMPVQRTFSKRLLSAVAAADSLGASRWISPGPFPTTACFGTWEWVRFYLIIVAERPFYLASGIAWQAWQILLPASSA